MSFVVNLHITGEAVAVPPTDYLTPNCRESKFIHLLAYRQIYTSTNYCKHSFFPRTAVHWNALPISIVMLPTILELLLTSQFMLFLSHLLKAGCDIGVQISVRPFIKSVNIYVSFIFLYISESQTLHSNCPWHTLQACTLTQYP